MSEELTPQKERFLREVEQQLLRKELDARLLEDGLIHVRWNERPLCSVDRDGIVRFRPPDIAGLEVDRQLRTVIQAAGQVKEYMRIFECAPALKAVGLEDTFKVLADFGDAVLAGQLGKKGARFVTWEWDFDRQGVHTGHYHMENYEAAKLDFAVRAGLVNEQRLFSDEQLAVIGKYLVGCGAFLVPEKLIGYINYEAVGIEFCDAHGGAPCARGYVVQRENLPRALLEDLNIDPQQKAEPELLTRYLRTTDGKERELALPVNNAKLKAVQQLGTAQIDHVQYFSPYLGDLIPTAGNPGIQDYNELAKMLGRMDAENGELLKYTSVLSAEKPETMQDEPRERAENSHSGLARN